MNKKIVLTIAGLIAGTTLFAGTITESFTSTDSGFVKKNPGIFTKTKDQMTMKGVQGRTWTVFDYIGIKSEKGSKIYITMTAKGKGKIFAGYFGYKSGYNCVKQEDKELTLTDKPTEIKLEFPLSPAVKIVRPRFRITPGSEICVTDFKVEVK